MNNNEKLFTKELSELCNRHSVVITVYDLGRTDLIYYFERVASLDSDTLDDSISIQITEELI